VEILQNGNIVTPASERQRALLAMLLLEANRFVSTQRLVDLLWDDPPRSALGNLRTYAAGIRALLGDGLSDAERLSVRRGVGYRIRVAPDELDVTRFHDLVAEAKEARARGDTRLVADRLERALGCWRGVSGSDMGLLSRSGADRLSTLNEQRLTATESLAEAKLDLGESGAAIEILAGVLSEHPTRDNDWTILMRARHAVGDVRGALETHRRAYAAYQDMLGISPPTALSDLHRAILQRDTRAAG
jgi:DNA-binding SARP family transcriptional activator